MPTCVSSRSSGRQPCRTRCTARESGIGAPVRLSAQASSHPLCPSRPPGRGLAVSCPADRRQTCPPRAPTCEDGEPAHGGEGVVAGRVQDVQLVHVASDVVDLPVEVLDGGRVLVLEAAVEEAGDDGALAHPRGAQHHHPIGVLGGHAECAVPAGQGLHHGSGRRHRAGSRGQEALHPVLQPLAGRLGLLRVAPV